MIEGCPLCGVTLRPRHPARDYVTGEWFEIHGCARCGYSATLPRPAEQRRAAYYPPAYYGAGGVRRFPAPAEWLQRRLYAWRAARVERLAGGPGRVLDIGCGPGGLLEAFRKRGWEVHGVELSDAAARRAREERGLAVHVGDPPSWPWADGHFDAVTMWHVLEHWDDPRAALRQVARLLCPGGVFLAGVPNVGSLEARLSRGGWFHLDAPRHLGHFTPRALEGLLDRAGFEVRSVSYVAPEYDLFSFVQSVENLFGLPQNLLYDRLRGRGARGGGESAGRGATLLAGLAALPLAAAGLPLTTLAALCRTGSSMTVLARLPAEIRRLSCSRGVS